MRAATVRLQTDVELLEGFGVPAVHHPDILLAGPQLLGTAGRPDPETTTIGVNIFERTGQSLAKGLIRLVAGRSDLRLVFMHSHLPAQPQRYEIQPEADLCNVSLHRYTDPAQTCETIASLDLLITSKLHLGVTALASGVPFVSYAGPPKATAFLDELGAGRGVYDAARSDELLDALSTRDGLDHLSESFPWAAIDTAKQASSGHLTALRTVIAAESEDRVDG
jgi:hypothetical protein